MKTGLDLLIRNQYGKDTDKNGFVLDSRVKYFDTLPQSVKNSNWEIHKLSISNLLKVDKDIIQKNILMVSKIKTFSYYH